MDKFKKIKVMTDFGSSGLWNGKDGIMIDYEDLNLTQTLIDQFENWIYNLYDHGYKKDYSGLKKECVKPVYEEGLRLSKELKKFLPHIEIIYESEHANLKYKKKL